MLVRLLPDQVAENWEMLKHGIEEAMPPIIIGTPDKMNNLFESLLIGKMVCWASMVSDEEMEGFLITTIQEDGISGTRSFLVFCIYSFSNSSSDLTWQEGLRKLADVARTQRCDQIIGYTTDDGIAKFVERIGGDASQRFITIPLYQNGTQREE